MPPDIYRGSSNPSDEYSTRNNTDKLYKYNLFKNQRLYTQPATIVVVKKTTSWENWALNFKALFPRLPPVQKTGGNYPRMQKVIWNTVHPCCFPLCIAPVQSPFSASKHPQPFKTPVPCHKLAYFTFVQLGTSFNGGGWWCWTAGGPLWKMHPWWL